MTERQCCNRRISEHYSDDFQFTVATLIISERVPYFVLSNISYQIQRKSFFFLAQLAAVWFKKILLQNSSATLNCNKNSEWTQKQQRVQVHVSLSYQKRCHIIHTRLRLSKRLIILFNARTIICHLPSNYIFPSKNSWQSDKLAHPMHGETLT